LEQV
jgi:hypothetical protein